MVNWCKVKMTCKPDLAWLECFSIAVADCDSNILPKLSAQFKITCLILLSLFTRIPIKVFVL